MCLSSSDARYEIPPGSSDHEPLLNSPEEVHAMKAIIEAALWAIANVLGVWLVVENLSEVGRLGAVAAGFLILLTAWAWIVFVGIRALRQRTVAGRSD
jgi:hypothetical protein